MSDRRLPCREIFGWRVSVKYGGAVQRCSEYKPSRGAYTSTDTSWSAAASSGIG